MKRRREWKEQMPIQKSPIERFGDPGWDCIRKLRTKRVKPYRIKKRVNPEKLYQLVKDKFLSVKETALTHVFIETEAIAFQVDKSDMARVFQRLITENILGHKQSYVSRNRVSGPSGKEGQWQPRHGSWWSASSYRIKPTKNTPLESKENMEEKPEKTYLFHGLK